MQDMLDDAEDQSKHIHAYVLLFHSQMNIYFKLITKVFFHVISLLYIMYVHTCCVLCTVRQWSLGEENF